MVRTHTMHNTGKTRRERDAEKNTITVARALQRAPVILNQKVWRCSDKGKRAYTRKGRSASDF